MNKFLTLLLLGVFATGFNSAIYAGEKVGTEEKAASAEVEEEPDCD